jgi:YD repeat-containing protein
VDAVGGETITLYDVPNRTQTIINGLGNTTIAKADERGNVIELVQDPSGENLVTRFTYDVDGRMLSETDPLGNVTAYTYNADGQLESVTLPHSVDADPSDYATFFFYGPDSETTVYPGGATETKRFDHAGNLTAVVDGIDHVLVSYQYGPRGQLLSETDTLGTTEYTYGSDGRLHEIIDSSGNRTTTTWNDYWRLTSLTDQTGTSTFEYDNRGRKLSADYGEGLTTSFSYGVSDFWTSMESSTIGTIDRQEDAKGRPTGFTTSDGQTTFEYDAAGRFTRQVDASGQVTEFVADAVGRVEVEKNVTTGTQTAFEYDGAGRVTKRTDSLGHATEFTYTPDGRLATMEDARNHTWTYEHTPLSMTTVDPLGRQMVEFYSPQGLPVKTVLPNGATVETTYRYPNPAEEAEQYPTSVVDSRGPTRSFEYDDLDRLTQATDAGGHSYSATYGADKQTLTGPTGESLVFHYDADRRLTSLDYPDGGQRLIEYGQNREISKITLPSQETITLTYDSDDNLVDKQSSSGETVHFEYQDSRLQSVTDDTGTEQFTCDVEGRVCGIEYSNGASLTYQRDLLGKNHQRHRPCHAYLNRVCDPVHVRSCWKLVDSHRSPRRRDDLRIRCGQSPDYAHPTEPGHHGVHV